MVSPATIDSMSNPRPLKDSEPMGTPAFAKAKRAERNSWKQVDVSEHAVRRGLQTIVYRVQRLHCWRSGSAAELLSVMERL